MKPREAIRFEDLPNLCRHLGQQVSNLNQKIDTLTLQDYYVGISHRIMLQEPPETLAEREIRKLNAENEDILEYAGIQCVLRPYGNEVAVMPIEERNAKNAREWYKIYLDGGDISGLTDENKRVFMEYASRGLGEAQVEDLTRESWREHQSGATPIQDKNTVQPQVVSWEALNKERLSAFIQGIKMMGTKSGKEVREIATWIINCLDMKLRYWFFEHEEGTNEFIENIELFRAIIDLDTTLNVNILPKGYSSSFASKTLNEYIELLSLGIDIENPNYSVINADSAVFTWWVRSVFEVLQKMTRVEAKSLRNSACRHVLDTINNRLLNNSGENWSSWEGKIGALMEQ